jgi:5'-3' exonuclease
VLAEPGKCLLLDTASLYFRAFYGVPQTLTAPDGTPVNAVRGMLDFLTRLLDDVRPSALAACWDDDWRPQWRVDLIPSYKAHRVVEEVSTGTDVEETPDPLATQVPIIREALELLGIAVVGAEHYEADDVIGTLTERWAGPVDIVTGDRDLFQLVDADRPVRVLYTARGVGRHEVVTAAEVRRRYGVGPEQYADFAALRGDASDGLPGVKGIGDKSAASLLCAHGDLAGVRAAAERPGGWLGPAQRRALIAAADYLDVAPTVVQVARDIDLGEPDLSIGPPDADGVAALAEQWGLGGSADRALAAVARATS